MSLPTMAVVFVNCVPVNCMPSPESPAKRMVTASSSSMCFSSTLLRIVVDSMSVSTLSVWKVRRDALITARLNCLPVGRADCDITQNNIPRQASIHFALCPLDARTGKRKSIRIEVSHCTLEHPLCQSKSSGLDSESEDRLRSFARHLRIIPHARRTDSFAAVLNYKSFDKLIRGQ